MSYEEIVRDGIIGVKHYKDRRGQHRFVAPGGKCALILSPKSKRVWEIGHIYTSPDYRRKGLAKQLLAFIRGRIGMVVHHSSFLSPDGAEFSKSVK